MYIDIETVKGLLLAGGGITLSELEILEGWVGLAIKIVAFAAIVIHLFRTINKWKQQKTKENV